jgi:hypothetical protein
MTLRSIASIFVLFLTLVLSPTLAIPPHPDADICPDVGEAHDHNAFHTLWNAEDDCHYDHEHGVSPFTEEVALAFPGFDLRALLGDVEVGHTNPSSEHENTDKHGGFKWNVQLIHPKGCDPFEGSALGVNGSVIQYHAFGDANLELEGSIHSVAMLIRQCRSSAPLDYGYMYAVQHVNYGQRVTPYQGTKIPYADSPVPAYNPGFGPYWSIDCVSATHPQCRPSLEYIRSGNRDSNTVATTKPPTRLTSNRSRLTQVLFRVRDNYQVFDFTDFTHPFTYPWICSVDGTAYDPDGCRYNNSTTQVQEIAGVIPPEWDNLAGFDADPEVGRITAEGFVTRFGDLAPSCAGVGTDCHPIKLVRAFPGFFGSVLVFTPGKGTNIVPYLPDRDIYFCGETICTEKTFGSRSSGWIGMKN